MTLRFALIPALRMLVLMLMMLTMLMLSNTPNLGMLISSHVKNIATGETSQAITPFHFFDNFNFHH